VDKLALLVGTELNMALIELFRKRINTAIIASIDGDYRPHTAPFNHIAVYDSKHLRVAMSKYHQTLQNIIDNVYVALEILDEGDIAVCIKGTAQIVKEAMDADCNMVIIEIEILEIRKNNSLDFFVTQGIRIRHKSEPNLHYSRKIFQELLQGANIP
jgi:Pyridoxamine 5''-phosphate oxidase.